MIDTNTMDAPTSPSRINSDPSVVGDRSSSDDDSFVGQHDALAQLERRTWSGVGRSYGALAARRAPVAYPLPQQSRALLRRALARMKRLAAGRSAAVHSRAALTERRRALRRARLAVRVAAEIEAFLARERNRSRSRLRTSPFILRIARPPAGGWEGLPTGGSSSSSETIRVRDVPRELDDVLLSHVGDVCVQLESHFRRLTGGLYTALESLLEQAEWVPPAPPSFDGLRSCFEDACERPHAVVDINEQHSLFSDVVKDELESAGFSGAAATFLLPAHYQLDGTPGEVSYSAVEANRAAKVVKGALVSHGLSLDLRLLSKDIKSATTPALPSDHAISATLDTALREVKQKLKVEEASTSVLQNSTKESFK